METTLTVTAKGEVTLGPSLLAHLGAAPGDQVVVARLPAGRIAMHAVRATGDIAGFLDCLPDRGISVSIADMSLIVSEGWAGKTR